MLRPIPFLLLAGVCLATAATPARAQEALGLWSDAPSAVVQDVRAGIQAYYRFDYDEAMRRFDRVVAARPSHPVGYFLRAEASWWLYLNDRRNAGAERRLEQNLDTAIALGEKRLDQAPDDVEALFIVGSAYGRKGMLAGTRKDAWQAARNAQKAKQSLDRLQELAPGNVDAVAAEGLYEYYVGTFGSVTRTASRLLFGLKGDKRAGLAALDEARRGGTYTRTEAAFFEGLFYLQYEDRPGQAQVILDRLRERFPENLYFLTMAAYARQRQGALDQARGLYESGLQRLARTPVYGAEGQSITRLFYGQTLMGLGDLEAARDQFVRVVQLRATESDAYPHAYLCLGRLADLRGERSTAEQYYRRVLQLPDAADSHDAARGYLDEPFSTGQVTALVAGAGR